MSSITTYLTELYTNFNGNPINQKAIAIILPIVLLVAIIFFVLLIKLFTRKKAQCEIPTGSPPMSESKVSIAQADIIPRPSSTV